MKYIRLNVLIILFSMNFSQSSISFKMSVACNKVIAKSKIELRVVVTPKNVVARSEMVFASNRKNANCVTS